MQFVTVRDFRMTSAAIWKKLLKEPEMVITNNGKPIALLTPITEETMEKTISSYRQAQAMNAVREMQEISVSLGNDKLTLEEINAIIKEVRDERRALNESFD